MNQPILRPASSSDLNTVMDFYRSYIGTPGCTWDDNYPNNEILLDDHASGSLYGLYLDSKLIGAISISKENYMDDLPCWQHLTGAKEISRVVISPEFRGQHYGTQLLQMTFEHFKSQGGEAVHLLVSPHNHRALQLYYSQQFENRGQYFLYRHDYLALEKTL